MAGLYVHIPFCVKKCAYCDFVSFEGSTRVQDYLSALKAEMQISAFALPQKSYDTVFLGGGTPSSLPKGAVYALLAEMKRHFAIEKNAEITIECNPGTVDEEKLLEYKQGGVNRLSFGLQSASDALLKKIGRIHTYGDFLESFMLARKCGFRNVNVDIMYALPDQTENDLLQALEAVRALNVEHISAYSLILEEGTPLFRSVESGKARLPGEDEAYALHRLCIERLQALGYERYEISNYARLGDAKEKSPYKCRHNLNYWDNGEYLGLGLGAHSALVLEGGFTRRSNTVDLNEYINRCAKGELPLAESMPIERGEEMFECVMLALRKTEGLKLSAFYERFHQKFEARYACAVAQLEALDFIKLENGFARLTGRGLDMQNQALLHFMEEE